jgi:hypothetical protein
MSYKDSLVSVKRQNVAESICNNGAGNKSIKGIIDPPKSKAKSITSNVPGVKPY